MKSATKNHESECVSWYDQLFKNEEIYPFEDALIDRLAGMPICAIARHTLYPCTTIVVHPFLKNNSWVTLQEYHRFRRDSR